MIGFTILLALFLVSLYECQICSDDTKLTLMDGETVIFSVDKSTQKTTAVELHADKCNCKSVESAEMTELRMMVANLTTTVTALSKLVAEFAPPTANSNQTVTIVTFKNTAANTIASAKCLQGTLVDCVNRSAYVSVLFLFDSFCKYTNDNDTKIMVCAGEDNSRRTSRPQNVCVSGVRRPKHKRLPSTRVRECCNL
jgi:hypothetical protein